MAINPTDPTQNLAVASQNIMDIINKQQQMDKVQALLKLLEIEQKDIDIVGKKEKILNLELITEYTGQNMTKFLVKNETWRKSAQKILHFKDINDEQLIGYMDTQIILKMISHKRKRAQEIINGLKNEVSGTEVIPEKTRRKSFFGMQR